jgi:CRISPR type IV-associated protein Csf1
MARFLLNPPQPPFAAVFSTRQKQMMVFRTPLNWSREVIVLRYDDEMLLIRLAKVREAAVAWREIEALVGHAFGKEKAIKPPVGILSMTLQAAEIGCLRGDVVERLRRLGRDDLVTALDGLSTGEAWALASIVQLPEGSTLAWRRLGEEG